MLDDLAPVRKRNIEADGLGGAKKHKKTIYFLFLRLLRGIIWYDILTIYKKLIEAE
jgi:hypothetical protein